MMQVEIRDMATGNSKTIDVDSGATVSTALTSAAVNTSTGIEVFVNRVPSNLSQELYSGDKVQYSRTDLKGSTEAGDSARMKKLVYEDIINAGKREVSKDPTLWDEFFADRIEKGRKAIAKVACNIFTRLERQTAVVSGRVENLEKELAAAKKQQQALAYATDQAVNSNNLFSAMAALGIKDMAPSLCEDIGVEVPAKDSPLWHTSADDGKKS